ncbi:MAG: hypothetical protein U9Q83_11220 [Bacteroidota bacterium]|nr:hypothetical protein [Bacteroidota bacterium]
MNNKSFLTIVASKRVAVSILNGLAQAIRANSEDKNIKKEYEQAMSDTLTSIEANNFTVQNEPFKTFAEMIHYEAK